jgi:hypothetical protein
MLTSGARKNKVSTRGMVEVPLVVGDVKAGQREFPYMVRIGFLLWMTPDFFFPGRRGARKLQLYLHHLRLNSLTDIGHSR